MLKRFKGEFFTLPNILSYARIALIPLIVWAYCGLKLYSLSAVLVALSGLTDTLDGIIARKCNLITDFGKIIDPIADKLTQISIVLCLCARYRMMLWLAGLLVLKEIFVGLMGFAVMKVTDTVVGSRWYGKLATILFYFVILLLLAFPTMPEEISNLLISSCIACMLLSLALYTVCFSKMLSKSKHNKLVE